MWLPFFLALSALILNSRLFPAFPLFTFAPFLALLITRKRMIPALWMAASAGLVYDLLSSNLHFGLYSLAFMLTTLFLFRLNRHFFESNVFSLALLTMAASIVFTLIHRFFLSSFGSPPPFTTKTWLQALLIAPIFDGLLSFFWFSCPLKLYDYINKKGIKVLFVRRKYD